MNLSVFPQFPRFTVECVAATIRRRGKVLLPVFALGRTQELLLLLNEYWDLNPEMKRIGKIIYLNQLAVKSMYLFRVIIFKNLN